MLIVLIPVGAAVVLIDCLSSHSASPMVPSVALALAACATSSIRLAHDLLLITLVNIDIHRTRQNAANIISPQFFRRIDITNNPTQRIISIMLA